MWKESISKYFNALKVLYSWEAGNIVKRPVTLGMPPFLGIELTNYCNLHCPECARGAGILTRPEGYMSSQLFDKIISETASYLLYVNLYFQGEPMLHPSFFEFAGKTRHLRTAISTNGHFLNEKNAESLALSGIFKIILSVDGMDQETYSMYRKGGDLEKVLSGTRELSKAIKDNRSPLKLELQFLVNRHNEHQIADARKFASEINAVLRLKSMQVLDEGRAGEWIPENKNLSRYRIRNNRYFIKGGQKNSCLRLWMNPVVTWDGKVVPCCFDKDASHVLGDLNFNSFSEIWHGEKAIQFRQMVQNDRGSIDICRNCTTGLYGVKH